MRRTLAILIVVGIAAVFAAKRLATSAQKMEIALTLLCGANVKLEPFEGDVPERSPHALSVTDRFEREHRSYVSLFGNTSATLPALSACHVLAFAEIAGVCGCFEREYAYTTATLWSSHGVVYLFIDVTKNISGNNQPHRFFVFRQVGELSAEAYEKVLDYEWKDGWSHPEWVFSKDGVLIAACKMVEGDTYTTRLTHRVLCNGRPLLPDSESWLQTLRPLFEAGTQYPQSMFPHTL